jgi:hypothetical protein
MAASPLLDILLGLLNLLSARQVRWEVGAGEGVILLRMRTPPIPIPNTLFSSSAVYSVYEYCCRGGCMFCVRVQRSPSCPPHSQRTSLGARTIHGIYTIQSSVELVNCVVTPGRLVGDYQLFSVIAQKKPVVFTAVRTSHVP